MVFFFGLIIVSISTELRSSNLVLFGLTLPSFSLSKQSNFHINSLHKEMKDTYKISSIMTIELTDKKEDKTWLSKQLDKEEFEGKSKTDDKNTLSLYENTV